MCVCFIPANLTSLITVFYLSSLLLVICHCLLNNFAKVVVPPTSEIRLNRQFVKLNRNLVIKLKKSKAVLLRTAEMANGVPLHKFYVNIIAIGSTSFKSSKGS